MHLITATVSVSISLLVPNGGQKRPNLLELIAVKDEVDILEWMRMASALE